MKFSSFLRKLLVSELDPRLSPHFHREFNSSPVVIYDIGAAGGVYTPFAEGPKRWAPVVAFEPHVSSYDRLKNLTPSPHVTLHRHAISNREGELDFHAGIGPAQTKSSLLPIQHLGLSSDVVKVAALRLDSVEATLGQPPANFLKLDTEGTEKEILMSGLSMLNNTVLGIRTEIAFWHDNPEATAFWEIDKLLTKTGFVLFDLQINRSASRLRSFGGRKDKVRSGDALYLKNLDSWVASVPGNSAHRIQLLKLISLSVAWGYLGYAIELANYGREENLFDQHEFELMVEPWLRTVDISDYLPQFYGRSTLARLFDFLSYTFNPNLKKGIPFPFNGIGNHWIVRRLTKSSSDIELYCPILTKGSKHRRKTIRLKDSFNKK